MTAQQIADEMILCGQNLVMEELMRHDDSIWDSLQNLDENSEVLEWVACDSLHGGAPQRKRRGDTGSIRLLLVGQTDIGTSSLHGLGDSEDSRADAVRRADSYRNSEGLPT